MSHHRRHLIDPLESRRLLSAVVQNGVLSVWGENNRNDDIDISLSGGIFAARVNTSTSFFPAVGVQRISAVGFSGNDRISIASNISLPAEINGVQGNDTLIGGSGNDTIIGHQGDDSLDGGAGNDFLDPGVDDSPEFDDGDADHITTVLKYHEHLGGQTIRTEGNRSTVRGGAGDDTLLSGVGSDDFSGGPGIDTVTYANFYARTSDTPYAYSNHTSPYHGPGKGIAVSLDNVANDGFGAIFSFGSNSAVKWEEEFDNVRWDIETVVAGDGNDLITGHGDANYFIGGPGNDTLVGGKGNDTLLGYAGDDTMDGGAGRDLLDGGANFDSADYRSRNQPLLIRLDNLANDGQIGEADNLINPEQILCGSGNDTVYGDARGNQIWGGTGNDLLRAGGGNDSVFGGGGNDVLAGDDGNDSLDGQAGNDTLYGNAGNDILLGGAENDYLDGGIGNDRLDGHAGDDILRGHQGNDMLTGGAGNDVLLGLEGDDWLYSSATDRDTVDGGSGNNHVIR